jgi:hypothetical protein
MKTRLHSTSQLLMEISAPSKFVNRYDESLKDPVIFGQKISNCDDLFTSSQRCSYSEATEYFERNILRDPDTWPGSLLEEVNAVAKMMVRYGCELESCDVTLEKGSGRGVRHCLLNIRSRDLANGRAPIVRQQVLLGTIVFDKWGVNVHRNISGISTQDSLTRTFTRWADQEIEAAKRERTTNARVVERIATKLNHRSINNYGANIEVSYAGGRNISIKFPEGTTDRTSFARSIQQSLHKWLPDDWFVEFQYARPSVDDLTFAVNETIEMLDHVQGEVDKIDEQSYKTRKSEDDYVADRTERRMSRATEILKQVSAHKDAVNKLSERIAETHDRMIQVIDNARSVASGTTSQLFD